VKTLKVSIGMRKKFRPIFARFVPFISVGSPCAELMAPLLHLLFRADGETGNE